MSEDDLEQIEYIPAKKLVTSQQEKERNEARAEKKAAGEIAHAGYSVVRKVGGVAVGAAVSGMRMVFARPPQQQQPQRQQRRMPPRQMQRQPMQQPRPMGFFGNSPVPQRQPIPNSVLEGFGMPVPKVLKARNHRRSRRSHPRGHSKGRKISFTDSTGKKVSFNVKK
jgi:hypothetical protein